LRLCKNDGQRISRHFTRPSLLRRHGQGSRISFCMSGNETPYIFVQKSPLYSQKNPAHPHKSLTPYIFCQRIGLQMPTLQRHLYRIAKSLIITRLNYMSLWKNIVPYSLYILPKSSLYLLQHPTYPQKAQCFPMYLGKRRENLRKFVRPSLRKCLL